MCTVCVCLFVCFCIFCPLIYGIRKFLYAVVTPVLPAPNLNGRKTLSVRHPPQIRPCRMRRLDVSRNPLGNDAGVALLGALVNECTEHLDLSYTELRGGEAGGAVGRLLRCHTIALRHLNLEHNALGRDGINEVCAL